MDHLEIMTAPSGPPTDIRIRSEFRPGDIGSLIRLHGELYAAERGWDWTFEAFAAQTFGRLADRWDPALDRIWIAERHGEIVGCIAILAVENDIAQLRWFLVHPEARGSGLGRRLIDEALSFCRGAGYSHVFLWTTASLAAAARLYRSFGFMLTHQETVQRWGSVLTEERYDLDLTP
jgi:N-acetylglutamate synthase-like GNAT family acetyltransferase